MNDGKLLNLCRYLAIAEILNLTGSDFDFMMALEWGEVIQFNPQLNMNVCTVFQSGPKDID